MLIEEFLLKSVAIRSDFKEIHWTRHKYMNLQPPSPNWIVNLTKYMHIQPPN